MQVNLVKFRTSVSYVGLFPPGRLKHVGIVRLRQEMLDTDKLGITFGESQDLQGSPQPVGSPDAKAHGKIKGSKPKPDALPSHNNFFRLCIVANIRMPDGSYLSSMSESIKCGKLQCCGEHVFRVAGTRATCCVTHCWKTSIGLEVILCCSCRQVQALCFLLNK